jgi:hypothetical protein
MHDAESTRTLAHGDEIVWSKVATAAFRTVAQAVGDGQAPADVMRHPMPPLTQRERATLFAALLYYQENRAHFGRPLLDIATSNGSHQPLGDNELAALIHRVVGE